jgi:hypothetical protein
MIKKLRAFDFDDTLFHTSGKVILTKGDGTVVKMSAAEYAVYPPEPGDKFDYSEFKAVVDPVVIRSVAKRFYKIVSAGNQGRLTVILTARGSESVPHIQEVLQKYFKVNIPVIAVGTSDPMAKANWIKDKIENEGYKDVFFIDDSPKNIKAVYTTIKDLPIKYKIVDLSGPRKLEGDNLSVGDTDVMLESSSGEVNNEFSGNILDNVRVQLGQDGDVNLVELRFKNISKSLIIEGDYLTMTIE